MKRTLGIFFLSLILTACDSSVDQSTDVPEQILPSFYNYKTSYYDAEEMLREWEAQVPAAMNDLIVNHGRSNGKVGVRWKRNPRYSMHFEFDMLKGPHHDSTFSLGIGYNLKGVEEATDLRVALLRPMGVPGVVADIEFLFVRDFMHPTEKERTALHQWQKKVSELSNGQNAIDVLSHFQASEDKCESLVVEMPSSDNGGVGDSEIVFATAMIEVDPTRLYPLSRQKCVPLVVGEMFGLSGSAEGLFSIRNPEIEDFDMLPLDYHLLKILYRPEEFGAPGSGRSKQEWRDYARDLSTRNHVR